MKMNAVVLLLFISIATLFQISFATKIKKTNRKLIFPKIAEPYEPEIVSKLPERKPLQYEEDEDDFLDIINDDNDFEEKPKIYSTVIEPKNTSIIHSHQKDGKRVPANPHIKENIDKAIFLSNGKIQLPIDISTEPVKDPILRNSLENPKFVNKEELKEYKANKEIKDKETFENNESLLEPEDYVLTEDEDNRKIKEAEAHRTKDEKIAALYEEKERIEVEMKQLLELIYPISERIKKSKAFVDVMQKILKKYTLNRNNKGNYAKTRDEVIEGLVKEIEMIKVNGEAELPYLRNLTINELKHILKELKKNLSK